MNADNYLDSANSELYWEDPSKPDEAAAHRSRAQIHALLAIAAAVDRLAAAVESLANR